MRTQPDPAEPGTPGTSKPAATPPHPTGGGLREVTRLALKLGATAFGGPAAHIAMLHDEVVMRRGWLTNDAFLDLVGATNLIPGPNSTEMVMHIGRERAGARGLVAAGIAFILPAAAITLVLAWAYARFGTTPAADWLLYGVKPVIIAVVLQALWNLGRSALKSPRHVAAGAAALVGFLLGVDELALLALAGLLLAVASPRAGATVGGAIGLAAAPAGSTLGPVGPGAAVVGTVGGALTAASEYSLVRLALVFLKMGSVLYGSGYVLLAFLRNDLVVRLGWLTDAQLLDAVAVGQFTPGPVLSTATFIGYLVGGWTGAVVATVAIFAPSFVFVAVTNPLVARVRGSPTLSALLDGVNAASLGLMAGVTLLLARAAIVDPPTLGLAVASGVLLVRFRVNSVWLVSGGAAAALVLWWAAGQ